jgi:hypothetical protein
MINKGGAMVYLILAAISFAVGIIGGLIQIIETINKHPGPSPRTRLIRWSIIGSTLLLAVLFFLASPQPGASAGNGLTQTSPTSHQATAVTTLPVTQTTPPTPTSVPSTPTPTPPPQCTNQNGTPPNGSVSTELMINCTLPSGSVALIVVCNEAQLLQPSNVQPYNQVQGAGIISYQNPAGSSSISMEAQNTALANASCPAKFLVVPLAQLDEQVAQETQRLKTLIGNNVGVTYIKVVGENSTKNYY